MKLKQTPRDYWIAIGFVLALALLALLAFKSAGQSITVVNPYLVAPSGPQNLLLSNLIAYWKLDETSGVRYDAHSTNDLTDNNTVGYMTGVLNNGTYHVRASDEWLYRTEDGDLSLGADEDFTVSLWVYTEADNSIGGIVGDGSGLGAGTGWGFYVRDSSTNYRFVVSSASASVNVQTAGWTLTTNTWYHFFIWHDATGNLISIRLNDTFETNTASTGTSANAGTPFVIGTYNNSATFDFQGGADEVAFWKRLLTSDEKTAIYGGGSPKPYSEWEE